MSEPAVLIDRVSYRYGQRTALDNLTLQIERGQLHAFLGPNGGGKTTLFRLLATLVPLQTGEVRLFGLNIQEQLAAIRRRIGVVFQAPSLDKKLTVLENMRCHAALYGMDAATFRRASPEVIEQLGLSDRVNDYVETLSGGLRRRVELAQSLLHRPELLLLDEPSTGLDPGARLDLWSYLKQLRQSQGTTIVLTTHLLEEADKADRLTILDQGRLVAEGAPDALRAEVGGESIILEATQGDEVEQILREQFSFSPRRFDDTFHLEVRDGASWIPPLFQALGSRIRSITLGQPTLEDVFIAKTGHRFRAAPERVTSPSPKA